MAHDFDKLLAFADKVFSNDLVLYDPAKAYPPTLVIEDLSAGHANGLPSNHRLIPTTTLEGAFLMLRAGLLSNKLPNPEGIKPAFGDSEMLDKHYGWLKKAGTFTTVMAAWHKSRANPAKYSKKGSGLLRRYVVPLSQMGYDIPRLFKMQTNAKGTVQIIATVQIEGPRSIGLGVSQTALDLIYLPKCLLQDAVLTNIEPHYPDKSERVTITCRIPLWLAQDRGLA